MLISTFSQVLLAFILVSFGASLMKRGPVSIVDRARRGKALGFTLIITSAGILAAGLNDLEVLIETRDRSELNWLFPLSIVLWFGSLIKGVLLGATLSLLAWSALEKLLTAAVIVLFCAWFMTKGRIFDPFDIPMFLGLVFWIAALWMKKRESHEGLKDVF